MTIYPVKDNLVGKPVKLMGEYQRIRTDFIDSDSSLITIQLESPVMFVTPTGVQEGQTRIAMMKI